MFLGASSSRRALVIDQLAVLAELYAPTIGRVRHDRMDRTFRIEPPPLLSIGPGDVSAHAVPHITMQTANSLFSADPDGVSAQIDLIGVPWLMIGEEP